MCKGGVTVSFDVKNTPNGWTCTDPDNYQFRRDNEDGSYTFKEIKTAEQKQHLTNFPKTFDYVFTTIHELWKQATIFITDYSRRDIHEILSAFYSEQQIPEVADIDNPAHHALIAECIFETEMYDE